MSEFNKSYRIRTEVGKDTHLHVKLEQNYDVLELMSLKINQENAYKLHSSNYGVVAGRVLANDAFGIPNAKVSVFIPSEELDVNDVVKTALYPYSSTFTKNTNNIRYNLLPDEQINNCHTIIGTFPEKQYLLDNNSVLEVFEKYYKYTTRTNNAGDYMIFGVPIGTQTIHVDIDLSDIGILSQKPRDMVYKGYNINQFENPNKFKQDTNLDALAQVISQNNVVNVIPFWGDEGENTIGISRCDINIQYKFEPTCVFMGSVVTDTKSNGISKKCIPTPGMGAMDEISTGSGTIEMIRKTPQGDVEEFQIQGTQLINGDGVWCYQIPMNLDYMMTDEFGNMVPTNDPNKGIPTRTKVRFRISLQEFDSDNPNMFPAKVLVPHNPEFTTNTGDDIATVDYQFGTNTKEASFKDLYWNGVYSVKSYIPRIQKGSNWKNEKFTGFKRVNYYGDKNPIPYNNIRIRLPFNYRVLCSLIKAIIKLAGFVNRILYFLLGFIKIKAVDADGLSAPAPYARISGDLCNDNLDNYCFIPGIDINKIVARGTNKRAYSLGMSIINFNYDLTGELPWSGGEEATKSLEDSKSIDYENKTVLKTKIGHAGKKTEVKMVYVIKNITTSDKVDYMIHCIEMNLAQEFRVIQFDFYNDWINGLIYLPRWMRTISKKYTFLFGLIKIGGKVHACNENYSGKRNIVQQCGVSYNKKTFAITNEIGCGSSDDSKLRCHTRPEVRKTKQIFQNSDGNSQGGIVKSIKTMKSQYVYYFKPSESNTVRLFATDIILLGTLNDCDKWGTPNNLSELVSSTYQLPPNLALTDSDIEGSDFEAASKDNCNIVLGIQYTDTTNDNSEVIRRIVEQVVFPYYGAVGVVNENNFGPQLDDKDKLVRPTDDTPEAKKYYTYCYRSLSPTNEDGNYTEMSGIDWGYNGPLQTYTPTNEDFAGYDKDKVDFRLSKLYNPGGHFLGLTCQHSATSIKSCVNLTRICEFGVWMSQRQTLARPLSGNKIEYYSTVPTGIISKDDINGTDYRRCFASMNKNKLKTIIDDKTGYPIYDFKYVNPTNFGGELHTHVFDSNNRINLIVDSETNNTNNSNNSNNSNDTTAKRQASRAPVNGGNGGVDNTHDTTTENDYIRFQDEITMDWFTGDEGGAAGAGGDSPDDELQKTVITKPSYSLFNRLVVKEVNEKHRIYTDDYYHEYETTDTIDVPEKQIMRLGEYSDKEYLKFRFGSSNLTNKNYFLIHDVDGETASFPVYDNSFYFYFGLHNGKTALDIFKENYYAKCETGNDLVQIDNSIVMYDLKVKNDDYQGSGIGEISFKINVPDDIIDEKDLKITLLQTNSGTTETQERTYNKEDKKNNNELVFKKLKSGKYEITIETSDNVNSITYNVIVEQFTISTKLYSEDFKIDISDYLYDMMVDLDRKTFGGYIGIDVNNIVYEEFYDKKEKLNYNDIERIVITFSHSGTNIKMENDKNLPLSFNVPKYGKLTAVYDKDNGKLIIPVPYANKEYSVYIYKDNNYSGCVGKVTINNGNPVNLYYNDINYSALKGFVENYDNNKNNTGWWTSSNDSYDWEKSENLPFQWILKSALYKSTTNVRTENNITKDTTPHRVVITFNGGNPGYYVAITGVNNNLIKPDSGLSLHDLYNVTIPTINYGVKKENGTYVYRPNFSIILQDSLGQCVPNTTPFKIPVIYKPFFMELIMWYFDNENNGRYFIGGNVYNGKTWGNVGLLTNTYTTDGYNNTTINDKLVPNFATVRESDTTMKINEPWLGDLKVRDGYGYYGEYCKYNGRKTNVSCEISPSLYGLYTDNIIYNFDISIGSQHEYDDTIYEEYTTMKFENSGFSRFKLVEKEVDGTHYVKMELLSSDKDNYDLIPIMDTTDYNSDDYYYDKGYPYPLNNNGDYKLFRDLIEEKKLNQIEYVNKPPTIGIVGNNELLLDKGGSINTRVLSKLKSNIYYIAKYKTENTNKTSSTDENVLRFVSVSKLIKYEDYPYEEDTIQQEPQ